MARQIDFQSHFRQGLAAHQRREAWRQGSLILVRKLLEENIGDDQTQDPVAQELQAFIAEAVGVSVTGGALVGQRLDQEIPVGEAMAQGLRQRTDIRLLARH